ncbi:class I SAM-dependent methyltransferase [Francisella philomiragia]|uniref:class I SAM-dependent methyltransferase n=1 Tax=Francisella philomiragia TaxID=28110 RepID=UPI000B59117B|nr:class I SAM-dependent methyltransferase [Francisella philomiragia]MBK2094779.1 class I SAM-dependent methyltransferase [Francisella philomiragia]
MNCKICNHKNESIFSAKALKIYDIKYYHCSNCGFLQTEEPYWLDEAYSESINISDTGYMQRNILLSQKLTVLLSLHFDKNSKFLDYAGGYGVFVRLMRDIGFDFYWDDKYTENFFARGFEFQESIEYEAITSFESFEHFVSPLEEIEKMLSISRNIIFSTEVLPNTIPKPNEWWYYGLDHGQHISFYSEKTFKYIAKKYDLHYINLSGLHLLTEKKIPKYTAKLLKLTKIGLHNILQRSIKSKTWQDHLKMSKKNENTI